MRLMGKTKKTILNNSIVFFVEDKEGEE